MNSLGERRVHRNPHYYMDKMARVSSSANFRSEGKIEVSFIDHGKCMPVWVVGDVDREPVEGDMVIIGYMEGRKDAPYLKSFVRNESYTSNYIEVGKEYIRFQLPLQKADREKNMLDSTNKPSRVYLELNASGVSLYHPEGDIFLNTPKGNVKTITKSGTQTL